MSAYKRIECEFKDRETLIEALDFLDLEYQQFDSPENLKGWKNDVSVGESQLMNTKIFIKFANQLAQ